MELIQTIIERWGFPVAFAVWLMLGVTRELREIRHLIQRIAVLNAVILKTLDVPEAAALAAGASTEEGK